ncbi:phage tail domain-containing protein [Fructilactobacillus fructivorans]|uniref:phage tail domain-containing protein n=1 Tax=Fructilactobacillus fructivorans TaxID=1614 RepID=UPI00070B3623|nr:phage tail domain-containing protein [Fructilactobacillus fructivorans]KRN40060.1 hypothetical protein IV51_GL000240 [Fructilactobacillus fructivorans]
MVGKPKLFISIDGNPEFNVTDKIPQLQFLGAQSNPALTNNYQDVTGMDGSQFNLAAINKNTVNLNFFVHFRDYYDFKAVKQQILQLFMQKRIYRIRTDAEPMFVQFLRPVTSEINLIGDVTNDSQFTLAFENPTGYKFSRFDSLNQADLWDDFPLGFNLPAMDKEDFHFIDEFSFNLLNPSGVAIDPYFEHHDLKIHLKWVGSKITLNNRTNGSSYTYNGSNNNNYEILLDGVDSFLHGNQVNNQTDFGNIKLEPGFNQIEVSGCTNFDVKFEFPFIYI